MVRVIYISNINRKDAVENPDALFIFGDNDTRKGMGGLAKELRGEPNAIGIRVKKKPSLVLVGTFYTDDEIVENLEKIRADIRTVQDELLKRRCETIIYPMAGIGTGFAQMEEKCPETYKIMCKELFENFGIINKIV